MSHVKKIRIDGTFKWKKLGIKEARIDFGNFKIKIGGGVTNVSLIRKVV